MQYQLSVCFEKLGYISLTAANGRYGRTTFRIHVFFYYVTVSAI